MQFGTHPLQDNWVLWEHQKNAKMNYEQNTTQLGTFNSVEDFWRIMHHYPKPSKFFFNGKSKPVVVNFKDNVMQNNREVASISLFKKDILPKWEDPRNTNGGETAIRKFRCVEELDDIWEKLCVNVIADQFQHAHNITGVRVVDSSIPRKALYRIEVWFDDKKLKDPIESDFKKILKLNPFVQLFYKEHSSAMETASKSKKYNHRRRR